MLGRQDRDETRTSLRNTGYRTYRQPSFTRARGTSITRIACHSSSCIVSLLRPTPLNRDRQGCTTSPSIILSPFAFAPKQAWASILDVHLSVKNPASSPFLQDPGSSARYDGPGVFSRLRVRYEWVPGQTSNIVQASVNGVYIERPSNTSCL